MTWRSHPGAFPAEDGDPSHWPAFLSGRSVKLEACECALNAAAARALSSISTVAVIPAVRTTSGGTSSTLNRGEAVLVCT